MQFKINISVVFDFEPEYYEDGTTAEQALAIELENTRDDPEELVANFLDSITVSGEIVP
jgi:hypothetical protein